MIYARVLISISSMISILFGIWHFFVPKIWNWYSYIDKMATELIVAVRAINVFFSASLVIFGLMNIIIIWFEHKSKLSMMVVISSSCILWIIRIIMQIIFPQGSMNDLLRFGMLIMFILTFILYSVGLILIMDLAK